MIIDHMIYNKDYELASGRSAEESEVVNYKIDPRDLP